MFNKIYGTHLKKNLKITFSIEKSLVVLSKKILDK